MKIVMLGRLAVGAIPRIVGTISSRDGLGGLDARRPLPCDIVEVRLDKIRPPDDRWMDKCASIEAAGYPVIVTVRAENEGGKWSGSAGERAAILERALPYVSAVDIELRNGVPAGLREDAGRKGVRLILSFHDFARTPAIGELREMVREARAAGADIVKIAAMVNSAADIAVLSLLASGERGEGPVCAIGMGKRGVSSRLSLPAAGSALAYGYVDRPCAPGQLPCAVLCRRLSGTMPAFKEDLIARGRLPERI